MSSQIVEPKVASQHTPAEELRLITVAPSSTMPVDIFGKHLDLRHPGVLVVGRSLSAPGVEATLRTYHRRLHNTGEADHKHREL